MLDPMKPRDLKLVGRFLRGLRRRGCEYFSLNEWHEGKRHHHVVVRTEEDLRSDVVKDLWRASCRGARVTSYCQQVRNVEGTARYITKDVMDPSRGPAAWFRGKLFSYSKGFLAAPLKELLRAVVAEWRSQVQNRSGDDQRGDQEERLDIAEKDTARDVPQQSAARPPCEYMMEDGT